jgi:hypothetical protein
MSALLNRSTSPSAGAPPASGLATYAKLAQRGRARFARQEKKVIRIKRVGEFWPSRRIPADLWKGIDIREP